MPRLQRISPVLNSTVIRMTVLSRVMSISALESSMRPSLPMEVPLLLVPETARTMRMPLALLHALVSAS